LVAQGIRINVVDATGHQFAVDARDSSLVVPYVAQFVTEYAGELE
jgi:hypothetical protein